MNLAMLLVGVQQTCVLCGQVVGAEGAGMDAYTALRAQRPRFDYVCDDCLRGIPWLGEVVCPVCGKSAECADCVRRTDGAFVQNRSAVRYEAHVPEWIALYKYQGHEAVGAILGELLDIAYLRLLRERRKMYADFRVDALIPVPLSARRLQERGFNQAAQLANCVAARHNIPLFDAMVRERHQLTRQSERSRAARLASTAHLYTVSDRGVQMLQRWSGAVDGQPLSTAKPVRVCIVDDIYTTGSTANACAQAIQQTFRTVIHREVEIYVLTLARA
jgi:predicted amidophosphoribosyltransferase